MKSHRNRRSFLGTSFSLALATQVVPQPLSLWAAAERRWPVGCRDLHLKTAGSDTWSAMKAVGAEVVEVNVGLDMSCVSLFHPDRKYSLAGDGIKVLKSDLEASGCKIGAFMMANNFEERLDQEIEGAGRLAKAAAELGVPAIRIDVVPRKMTKEEFLPYAIAACKRVCAAAEGTPVRFGVENHGKITNAPDFLEALFHGVDSPKLGLTLDCANFYWWGHPEKSLYSLYEKFAPKVVHTHCKSIRYPAEKRNTQREIGWEYAKYNCPIYEGDIDFKRLVGILRKANYRGDLCVEDESLGKFPEGDRAGVLKKEIELLKKLA